MQSEIENLLLNPYNLNYNNLLETLNNYKSRQLNYLDLYMQHNISEYWRLEDNQVKNVSYNINHGAAVHAISHEQSGFAYTEDISLANINQIAKQASCFINAKQKTPKNKLKLIYCNSIYPNTLDAIKLNDNLKIKMLEDANKAARSLDPRVEKVKVTLSIESDLIFFINTFGEYFYDTRPLVRLDLSLLLSSGEKKEQSHSGMGGRYSIQDFYATNPGEVLAKDAIEQALINIDSVDAPTGTMNVVLGPGWPGVLLHEAVGHGLEGDFNRKGSSAFTNLIGKRVANKGVTVIDDATIPNSRGSIGIDDEGVIGQKTTLIEDGVLQGYMLDRLNAAALGKQSTGNGRRESYAHPPLPRMTNTYMLSGNLESDEIIRSVSNGIYCTNFSGGQVDITSGKFVFSAQTAYKIENGKVAQPLKNLTLIGDGPSVLKQVSMIGNDGKLDKGVGICGKDGQSVPVSVGMPTVKIDKMIVGGSSNN